MTPLLASTPPLAGAELFERILGAEAGLVVLEGYDGQGLIANFRAIARHSGQAVYLWQPENGLGNLREEHARVPGCQRLGSALRYMQQSMHFGIYLMQGLELPLSSMDNALLRQLARAPGGPLRRVVLVDPPAALAGHLGDVALRLKAPVNAPQRPRLRDGRWIC
ncbi:hypothetical protein [Frateuria defendens]|uniref:hypothetical protein n=1 Tax=Frateuria defendens TaxID=2219559 RepID=UPI00066FEEDA|nr:hypothetical protein [Frateuria defendens]